MIDGHVHVWTLDAERYPWQPTLKHVPIPTVAAEAEDLLAEMDAAGVELAVLVQPSVYGWDNSYLCDSVDHHPGRFVGVVLVDPRSENAADDLRHWCAERGCRGLRVNLVGTPDDASWVLGESQARMFATAAELGIAVELQTLPQQAGVICELARGFPSVTFIIDYLGTDAFHDGKGLPAVALLAREPNVAFKLLSLSQDSSLAYPFADLFPLYEGAVAEFGADRVVFGTDFPHVRDRSDYAESARWLRELPFLNESEQADRRRPHRARPVRHSPDPPGGAMKLPVRHYCRYPFEDPIGLVEGEEELDAAQTVLLVVDVYGPGFDEGSPIPDFPPLFLRRLHGIQSEIVRGSIRPAIDAARAAGVPVVYVENDWKPACWPASEFAELVPARSRRRTSTTPTWARRTTTTPT